MDRNIRLHKIGSVRFLALLKASQPTDHQKALQNYLLCKAILQRRRRELADRGAQNADTSALQRMIARLEASQQAHLESLEGSQSEYLPDSRCP